MKIKFLIFNLLALSLLLFSCSVEKRLYSSGYHISKNSKNLAKKDRTQHSTKKQRIVEPNDNEETIVYEDSRNTTNEDIEYVSDLFASIDEDLVISSNSGFSSKLNETCDIIILKDGTEIKAKVLEINDDNIKYKMCDNLEGPTFTKNKNLIFMIKYPNGTSTVVNSMETPSAKNEPIRTKTEEAEKIVPSSAQWGLALSILGLFVPFGGVLMLTIGGLLGSQARKLIKENPNKYTGEKMAKAAEIISIIGLILWLILLIAIFTLI
jgi:hypothetical protein